jgi:predicted nucleic acid-binding protein
LIYADTSILMPYYVPEALSDRAQTFLRETPEIALSDIGEGHVEGGAYSRLELDPAVYHLARNWKGTFDIPLRTLDALHLAVAATSAITIATADAALARAGRSLGVSVHYLSGGGRASQRKE